jgi:hypothetical protein
MQLAYTLDSTIDVHCCGIVCEICEFKFLVIFDYDGNCFGNDGEVDQVTIT